MTSVTDLVNDEFVIPIQEMKERLPDRLLLLLGIVLENLDPSFVLLLVHRERKKKKNMLSSYFIGAGIVSERK